MAFPTGWTHRCEVVVDGAYVSGFLSNFSALLRIETAKLSAARIDLGDVRWSTDDGGTTQLAADYLYTWNSHAYWRVKLPIVLSGYDTPVYAWWGKADESLPAIDSTYGQQAAYDSNWAAYWPGSSWTDRVASIALSTSGSVLSNQAGGLSGPVLNFTGGAATSTATALRLTGDNAVSVCVDLPSSSSLRRVIGIWPTQYTLTLSDSNALYWGIQGVGTSGPGSPPTGWSMLTGTLLGTTQRLYVNGAEAVSHRTGGALDTSTTAAFALSGESGGANKYSGKMSHAQVHHAGRSTAWLNSESLQTRLPALFATAGTPITLDTPSFKPWYIPQNRIIGAA